MQRVLFTVLLICSFSNLTQAADAAAEKRNMAQVNASKSQSWQDLPGLELEQENKPISERTSRAFKLEVQALTQQINQKLEAEINARFYANND